MYLVLIPSRADTDLTFRFFRRDPRQHGCHYPVADVDLEDFTQKREEWNPGPIEPHVLARSIRKPTTFKVFESDLGIPLGWEVLEGTAEVWATWEAWQQSNECVVI